MGVSGLLPLLKSIQRPTELKKLQGKTLGVDGYGWLHRAAYSCALELGQDKPTDRYITAVMHRVRMLIHFGIKPYMVFDGDYLPSKARTEESRAKSRDAKKKLAMELLKAGKPAQATQEFQKCIDVTPEMASAVIHELKMMNIDYVVAPYEADSQLVYLERKGLIDGIISDDSDLLVFGAKHLLTKLDKYGSCIEIKRQDFCACREVSLTGWTDQDFRRMAILSGCDYLDGLPSVGLKTAYRMLRKSKTPERVVRMLQFQGKRVSENYMTEFYKAELTFLHQWVFCPIKKDMVHLTELDRTRTAEEMPFIGAYKEKELSKAIAKGDVNPITRMPIIIASTPTKRRHSQATAAGGPSREPARPIKSYFKDHNRIPMGDMDTNCFSVDPQRLAQITDGGLVPRIFPLPRPYLDGARQSLPTGNTSRTRTSPRLQRRRTEPIEKMLPGVSGTPAPTRRNFSIPVADSSSAPTPKSEPTIRPSKKARLCDDDDEKESSPKQSKFFPSLNITKTRKSKSDEYLMSDESFEETLRSLPDIDGWKAVEKPRRSISVFTESSQTTASQVTGQGRSFNASQETAISEPSFSQHLNQHSTTSEDLNSTMPPPKRANRHSIPSKTPSQSISKFYSSNPSTTPASSVASCRSSLFSAAPTPSTVASSVGSFRPTPLQRIAAKALKAPASPRRREPNKKAFIAGLPVNPSFVPLPKVDIDELEALTRSYGSEDQIVPDSDGEDDIDSGPPTKLDFSRYVCPGV